MTNDSLLPFSLPSVERKKITAAFDGGRLSSDGGVMLLGLAERRTGIADRLAAEIVDRRDPTRVVHTLSDILRAGILAIACGYEDADDLDYLRSDPALKLACGHLPDSGRDLCSQPTMSRCENAPSLREVIRLMRAMVGLYCASYGRPPASVTLDIDDTLDVVHGHQQLSMFNAHYDERCFLPIHVYDTATSRPVAVLLRPGKTPSGQEIRGHLRRLIRTLRRHWPETHITIRGDSHYGRPEVMDFCDEQGIDFVFGLAGNDVLRRLVESDADDVRVCRAEIDAAVIRRCTETRYSAKSWRADRRVVARIEATTQGLDIRFVVTSFTHGSAEWLYESLYCARGQAENLIKLHMWTAPLARVILQCFDQIACVHMSGLLVRSHRNAGQDGFRGTSSKHKSGLVVNRCSFRSISCRGSIDHTICSLSCKFWHQLSTVAVQLLPVSGDI